jgi:hypothetical protein
MPVKWYLQENQLSLDHDVTKSSEKEWLEKLAKAHCYFQLEHPLYAFGSET